VNPRYIPGDLELAVAGLCGLSALLAPGILRRALADVGASSPPTRGDLLRALPALESRMRAYLPHDEVVERSVRIRRLLDGSRLGWIAIGRQG
jgi:hypothetical protein